MASQVSPKPAGKHDAYISAQLARAEQRIRLVDLLTALAGFVAGTLFYALAVIVLDRALVLSAGTRQTLLLFYGVGAGVYLYLAVVRPLRWRVNPLYAARQLEQTMPGQRNHLVNWIDLRDEKLPGVIRASLGQRTAKDLSKTDVDQAISNRRAWLAAGGVGAMGFALIVLVLLFGPGPFGSFLARAIAPFGSGGVPSRTQIVLLRPESGDLVVTIGKAVTVVADVSGRVPSVRDRDAPCLLYRQEASEPYRKRYLQYDESGRNWVASVAPIDVGNGFLYKVTAGDAETPEYRVTTRATPLIAHFLATYRHRPYTGWIDRSKTERKLDDLRGTEVHIVARTNRILKDARLDFEAVGGGGDIVRGALQADDPRAMRFRFVLDRPGKYRLRFSSAEAEGETYLDPMGHDVVVQPDQPPVAQITQPDKDVQVPANGHVPFRGEVSDDIGIAAVVMRMRVVDGPTLQSLPYLADRLGKPDFGTPRQLDYRELVELPKLRDEAGKPFAVQPGMTIECWLEARDGCDFPKPNVGESTPRRRIVVTAAKQDAEQQKNRDRARQEKAAHEKKQQDDLKKQKADQEKQRQKDEAEQRAEDKRREEEAKGKEPQEKEEPKKPEETPEKTDPKEEETTKTAEEIKKALDKQADKQEKEAGEGKGPGKDKEEPKPGKCKETGQDKAVGKDDKPGACRDQGKKDGKSASGEKKDAGKGGEPGAGRGEGKPESGESKGQTKESGPEKPGKKPGEGKPEQTSPRQSQDKGPGKASEGAKPGESKSEGDKPPTDKSPQGEAKDSKAARDPKKGDNCPCEGKPGAGDKGKPGDKGAAKPGADPSSKGGQAGQGKPASGAQPGAGKGGPDDKKNAAGQARGAGGGQGGNQPKPEDATAQDAQAKAGDLASGNDDTRQAAAKDLKDIAERAKDEKARAAAREALDKAREGFEKPDAGPAPPPDAPPMQDAQDARGEDVGRLEKMARGNSPQGGGAWARGKLGDIARQAKDDKARKAAREALDKGWQEWLAQADKRKREAPGKQRPSALQLEEFRKKVDPNVLKDMKMSKEQFEQFMRDYAALAKRPPKAGGDEDRVPGVGRSTGRLPGMSGATIQPGKGSDELRGTGQAKPPPEYRDGYRKFLQGLNPPR